MTFIEAVESCVAGFTSSIKDICLDLNNKDDEATVASSASIEDLKQKKAVKIQAHARGYLMRKQLSVEYIKSLITENKTLWNQLYVNQRSGSVGPERKFFRLGFVNVNVKTESNKVKFVSTAEESETTFDLQPCFVLPEKLAGIFNITYDEDQFIDFLALLNKALLLRKSKLNAFLGALKSHLLTIQNKFKEVSAWLEQPRHDLTILEDIFSLDVLSIPDTIGATKVLQEREVPDSDFKVSGCFNIHESRSVALLRKMQDFP